ncbi:MAG: 50S ribosomal protein L9 [Actinomycetota bacterium]|nr:50S ribosomal protein L9 [Actinomycetota bacterium]
MRLVLRSDLPSLGKRGDVVEVADGYARNYLVPKGLALLASGGTVAQASFMRKSRDVKDARAREDAEQVARRLVAMVIRVPARAGASGKLFGSVTAADIADAVEEQAGIHLDRRRLVVDDPIRSIGTHEVPVKLHSEVEFRVTVEVVPG